MCVCDLTKKKIIFFPQKFIIFAFVLIATASAARRPLLRRDVSEIVQGDGWYKDASGYHYTEPEKQLSDDLAPLPAPVEQVVVEEPVYVEEPVVADEPVVVDVPVYADEPVYVPEAPVADETPLSDPYVVEDVVTVEEVPVNNLREYLPPKSDELKRKRQVPARKVVRKVYRRYVRKTQQKKRL